MTNDKEKLFDDIADIVQEQLADLGTRARMPTDDILVREWGNVNANAILDKIEALFNNSVLEVKYNDKR